MPREPGTRPSRQHTVSKPSLSPSPGAGVADHLRTQDTGQRRITQGCKSKDRVAAAHPAPAAKALRRPRAAAAFRPSPPTRPRASPAGRQGRYEIAGCELRSSASLPAARQIASACVRISRSSALTGTRRTAASGSAFAADISASVAHRHQPGDEKQIARADRGRAALEQRRNRRDNLLRGLAVFRERDGVNFDARLRHDEAGRRGRDDRRRRLRRENAGPRPRESPGCPPGRADRPAPSPRCPGLRRRLPASA